MWLAPNMQIPIARLKISQYEKENMINEKEDRADIGGFRRGPAEA